MTVLSGECDFSACVWTSWLYYKSVHMFTHYHFSVPNWLLWFHGFAVSIISAKNGTNSQKEALFNWYLSGDLRDKENDLVIICSK